MSLGSAILIASRAADTEFSSNLQPCCDVHVFRQRWRVWCCFCLCIAALLWELVLDNGSAITTGYCPVLIESFPRMEFWGHLDQGRVAQGDRTLIQEVVKGIWVVSKLVLTVTKGICGHELKIVVGRSYFSWSWRLGFVAKKDVPTTRTRIFRMNSNGGARSGEGFEVQMQQTSLLFFPFCFLLNVTFGNIFSTQRFVSSSCSHGTS